MTDTLAQMAVEVLTTPDGRAKTALSRAHAARWFAARAAGETLAVGSGEPPCHPARPARPQLLSPRDVPKRKPGSPAGRIALLHAVAHIELNAVDLHWDIIARFAHVPMPPGFYDDWVKAADEESKHFNLVSDCLEALGSHYGALPAHAGMWRAAEATRQMTLPGATCRSCPWCSRLVGLDVTPAMIETFRSAADDPDSVAALDGDLCRGSRARGLWLQVVPLPLRA